VKILSVGAELSRADV